MNWLNENAGVLILITAIIILALIGVIIWHLLYIRSTIAVRRLSFLGFYSKSLDTHKNYADFTIGNRTLHTVGVSEIGLQNGRVSFNLTDLYREKAGLPADAKIVIVQRSSLTFRLTADELKKTVIKKDDKLKVGTLRAYAVDSTGALYRGSVPSVRRMLLEGLAEEAKAKENQPSEAPKTEETKNA